MKRQEFFRSGAEAGLQGWPQHVIEAGAVVDLA
jgi:hypothetical protein